MNKLIAAAGLLVGLALALSTPDGRAQLPTSPGYTLPTSASPLQPNRWATVPAEEPNKDLLVRPECGQWMILLINYEEQDDEDVSLVARDLINELRSELKLPAYTYNYGLQERRKEIERVHAELAKRRAQYQQMGADATKVPIRVGFTRYKVDYGVLIGGYPSQEAALHEKERLKSCKLSDAKRYRLPAMYMPDERTGEPKCLGYQNPFLKAMVVRNPTLAAENNADSNKLDVAQLRRLNEDESYSLLKNPRPYTLVVKQYMLPGVVQPKIEQAVSLLQQLGIGGPQRIDAASENAHQMAETLRRQSNLDAYVLHTQYASFVTVGGFDSPDDPRMQAYQQAVRKINENIRVRANGDQRVIESVSLIPVARPMAVPR
jgi:hypothetical protein